MAREPVDSFVDFDQPGIRQRAMSYVGTLRGIWHWRMEPKRNTRTLRQNSFYFAARVTPIYELMRENHTEGITCKNDVHEMLKSELLRVDIIDPDSGALLGSRPGSTRKLTVEEMTRYIEDCRDLAESRFGIDVLAYEPEPAATRRRALASVAHERSL